MDQEAAAGLGSWSGGIHGVGRGRNGNRKVTLVRMNVPKGYASLKQGSASEKEVWH